MRTRRKSELRAGLFINLAAVLFVITLFFFGGSFNPFSRGIPYHFTLPDALGLMKGAKVLVSGVDAGEVSRLEVDPSTGRVIVDVSVSRRFGQVIRQDSIASLSTQGVLGDKVVMITPGNRQSPALPQGGELHSRALSDVSQVVSQGDLLLRNLNSLILALDRVAQPLSTTARTRQITRDASLTLAHLARLTEKLDRGVNAESLTQSLAALNGILSKINDGSGTLGALVNDPGIYDDLKALTGGANQSRVIRNLTRAVIEKGETNEARRERQERSGAS